MGDLNGLFQVPFINTKCNLRMVGLCFSADNQLTTHL